MGTTASMATRINEKGRAMTDQEYKVRENRLRRAARRQGLQLEKSRRRDTRAIDWGTYHLVDPYNNTLVAYGLQSGYGMTLDEVAEQLFGDQS